MTVRLDIFSFCIVLLISMVSPVPSLATSLSDFIKEIENDKHDDPYLYLLNMDVRQRIRDANDLLQQTLSSAEHKLVLQHVADARRHTLDAEILIQFFVEVGQRNLDPSVRAYAFECAAKSAQEHHRYEDARRYYETSYALMPTRDEQEWIDRLDISYQLAKDLWHEGQWKQGLEDYILLAREYCHVDHFLLLFTYFEAIPVLTNQMMKDGGARQLEGWLEQLRESENTAELFAASMMAMFMEKQEFSDRLAEKTVGVEDNHKFNFLYHARNLLVAHSKLEIDNYQKLFNTLAENPIHDKYLARITSVFSTVSSVLFPEQWGKSLMLFETYLNSEIFTDMERRQNISDSANAHILINYAIDLMYNHRRGESLPYLIRAFEEYPHTDSGYHGGLVLAEHYINHRQFEQAEQVLYSLPENAKFDRDTHPAANVVWAKLYRAKGDSNKAKRLLDGTLSIPERKGNEAYIRYKNEAARVKNLIR